MPVGYDSSRNVRRFPLDFTTGTSGTVPPSGGGTTNFLRADGSWAIPAGTGVTSVAMTVPTGLSVSGSPITTSGTLAVNWSGTIPGTSIAFANPSATIGLSAVNGTATTPMTSDSAPALSQAIVPTWTGTHTFTSTGPQITLGSTGSGHFGQINLNGSTSGTSQIFVTSTGSLNITGNAGGGVAINDGANGEMFGANNANAGTAIANQIVVFGESTGSAPILSSQGTDTNIDINLFPKGTGVVQFHGSFAAKGSVAATIGNVPTVATSGTQNKWLTIKDASGTVTYIPVWQ